MSNWVNPVQTALTPTTKSHQGFLAWLLWLSVALLGLPPPVLAQVAPLARLFEESQSQAYEPPSPGELQRAEYLFRQALIGVIGAEQRAAWASLGFQIERISDRDQVFTVIRERPDRRQGRGFFVLGAPTAGAPILQAPHALNDKHTGLIAIGLLTSGRFAAGAWSTAPRRYQNEDDATVTDSDMAHQVDSYFTAFTRAAAQAQPSSAILQLHGFSNAKRKTEPGRKASAIISAGEKQNTSAVQETVRCLRSQIAEPVLSYPEDVKELGALTNEIGELLRKLGRSSFVHIEMASGLREHLHKDDGLRQRIGACLARVRP
jgi:hypothetical protein